MTNIKVSAYTFIYQNFIKVIMKEIKILIADDHPSFREGLCRLLNEQDDMDVIGVSADGEETICMTQEMKPDIVIIDVAMPGTNGIEAARQIKRTCPTTSIIMVSAYSYESYVLTSMQAGASGYLLKDAPVGEIISAIRLVYNGQGVFNLKASSKVLSQITIGKSRKEARQTDLHDREIEVLELAAKGMTNKDIAEQLFISERTVHNHLTNIFRKLKVSSRTEAVLYALKKGWLTLEDLYPTDET